MLLRLQKTSFSFAGKNRLLNNISFNLEEGKIYALVGPNGAGKTTFFNLLSGFLKPTEGTILFKGQAIGGCPPYLVNRLGIGRTFQDLRLVSMLTVRQNILLAMHHNPTDNWTKSLCPGTLFKKQLAPLETKADLIIHDFRLKNCADALAGEISYGQQKLLTIACCVANDASLILLDEPVAGINPELTVDIATLLNKMKAHKKTILLIEHNTSFIDLTADKIFFLNEGEITQFGSMAKLRDNRNAVNAYM